jgi:hypothetical protein
MAKANYVKPEPVKGKVTLELSETEARLIHAVLGGHIIGGEGGLRGVSSRIYGALNLALPEYDHDEYLRHLYPSSRDVRICFTDDVPTL